MIIKLFWSILYTVIVSDKAEKFYEFEDEDLDGLDERQDDYSYWLGNDGRGPRGV